MRRELKVYLWDMKDAGLKFQPATAGIDLVAFAADEMLKAAVERYFTILGEAMVRIKTHFYDEWTNLIDGQQVIGLRNQLVYLYDQISDAEVWRIITVSLPILIKQIDETLERLQQK